MMNLLTLLVVTVLAVHVIGDGYTGHSISLNHKTRNVEHDAAIFEAQVKILGPKELKRFVQFGLTDGMRILDLGCGPGFMAEQLLIHFPNSHVTCVDIDEGLLEYNKKRHEKWITSGRLTVLHQWANDTKLPSESFDFVLSRLLFQHLRSTNLVDPVCKEVYRLLKPGGLFVVVDSDQFFSDLVEPNFDPMQRVERIFFELKEGDTTRPKSDNSSGRKLFTDLKRNGFENVESEVVLAHSDEHGFESILPLFDPIIYQELVNIPAAKLTKSKLEKLRQNYFRFYKEHTEAISMIVLFLAGGKKPGVLVAQSTRSPIKLFLFVTVPPILLLVIIYLLLSKRKKSPKQKA